MFEELNSKTAWTSAGDFFDDAALDGNVCVELLAEAYAPGFDSAVLVVGDPERVSFRSLAALATDAGGLEAVARDVPRLETVEASCHLSNPPAGVGWMVWGRDGTRARRLAGHRYWSRWSSRRRECRC